MNTKTPKLRLKKGAFVQIRGTTYRVDYLTSDRDFTLHDLGTGQLRQVTQADLLRLYQANEAQLNVPNPAITTEFERQCLAANFASALEDHQDIARRNKAFLDDLLAAPKGPRRKTWPPIIEATAKRIGCQPLSWMHLGKLMKKYLANRNDIRSLLPAFTRRGARRRKMSERELEFFNGLIKEHYCTDQRPTLAHVCAEVRKAYRKARREDPGAAGWKTPSDSTIYRRIKEIDSYFLMAMRHTKEKADQHFKQVGPGYRAFQALELVEIDHTVADITLICDKNGYVLGRPTVTFAKDKYTGMIVGVYVGFEPAGLSSLMQCLHNMILPKTYFAQHFPELVDAGVEWPSWGIPSMVLSDNGKEFHASSYKDICGVLSMDIEHHAVGEPWAKGMVERLMGIFNGSGLNWMPGKTFRNIVERAAYDSEGKACITLREFRMLLHAWIVLGHNTKMNSRTLQVPEDLWTQEVERNPPHLPPSAAMLDNLLGVMEKKTLTREGLELSGLHYNSQQLNLIFRDARFQALKNKKVTFKIDPSDLGEVAVIHPLTGHVFKVPCTEPDVSVGVSRFQHEQRRKYLTLRAMGYQNKEKLIQARDEISDIAQAMLLRNSTKNRKKLARILGGMLTEQPKAAVQPKVGILPLLEAPVTAQLFMEDDKMYQEAAKSMGNMCVPDAMRQARALPAAAPAAGTTAAEDIEPFEFATYDNDQDGETQGVGK